MLILTVALTKQTTALYVNPTKDAVDRAIAVHSFLTNINVAQLTDGLSFHIEAAKDAQGREYRDLYMLANCQYTMDGNKFISNGGIAVNVQPLINFMKKVIDTNK